MTDAPIDLLQLVNRLSAEARESFESALGLAKERGLSAVEVEHWAYALVARFDGAAARYLVALDIDPRAVADSWRTALMRRSSGGARVLVLDGELERWLREAWSSATLTYGSTILDGAVALHVALTDRAIGPRLRESSPALRAFDPARSAGVLRSTGDREAPASAPPTTGDALATYCRDLTAAAAAGKIDPVVGRDAEIRQAIDILCRRRQNNPILTGEAGVGKTAVAEGLALTLVGPNAPAALTRTRLLSLDLSALQAGASMRGEFETRLKAVIDGVIAADPPVILFIDEIHMLVGAGGAAGQADAANLMKPALARGELRTVGATTWAEYKRYFERDAALVRRFQPIKVEEPDDPTAIAMLTALTPVLERHHQVVIRSDALGQAVRLSRRYLPARQLPDKAISLLDTACARVSTGLAGVPMAVQDARWAVQRAELDLQLLERDARSLGAEAARMGALIEGLAENRAELEALEAAWVKEREAATALVAARRATAGRSPSDEEPAHLADLTAALTHARRGPPQVRTEVDGALIAEVLADWTGIPVGAAADNEITEILDLENRLGQRIIGQPHAIAAVSTALKVGRARLSDPRKPLAVLLMVGTSGVGKTETAHALAESCFGGSQSLTVINMSEFKEEHKVSMLVGSPPGYVGFGEGGVLTEAVRRRPYGVLLLDEIDQAHPGVQDVFYQVMDKGQLRDGEGRDIDFRNVVLLLATNVGSQTLAELGHEGGAALSEEALSQALRPELLRRFKPAFLGRTTLVPFLPLGQTGLERIVELKLKELAARLFQTYESRLLWGPEIAAHVARRCLDGASGARLIDQIISRDLLPVLAEICFGLISSSISSPKIQIILVDERLKVVSS